MSKLIYVETSIPSFYTETRDDEEIRIRRKWTREWWHLPGPRDLVTSFVVQDELSQIPDPKRRQASLQLIRPIEQFIFTPEVEEVVEVYLAHKLMPREGLGDAAFGTRFFLRLRYFGDVELQAPGQREQDRSHPAYKRAGRFANAAAGDAAGAFGERR